MKYFLHDTDSFNDEKITELYIKFGYEGLGLFYTILEKMAKQEKPIKADVLKHQLKIGKRLNKCWLFMEQIDLISSNNGETFNKQLLNFSEKYQIKKEKTRKKVSEWREKQKVTENVTSYVSVRNEPKVKESKVNVIKKNIEERKADFSKSLNPHLELYGKDLLNEFYRYWTEHGEKDRKMKFEKQKSFGIAQRLRTWNNNNFGNEKNRTNNKGFESDTTRGAIEGAISRLRGEA